MKVPQYRNTKLLKQNEDKEKDFFPPLLLLGAGTSSIWILLLSIAMMLSAIGDTGYAYSAAYGPNRAKEMYGYGISYIMQTIFVRQQLYLVTDLSSPSTKRGAMAIRAIASSR